MTTEEPVRRPLYARALRLRYLNPSGLWCFVFVEGMIALGVLLALTELVSWWAVLVLPASVAAMVKLNDLMAGAWGAAARPATARVRPEPARPAPTSGAGPSVPTQGIRQVSRDLTDTMDPVDSVRQRFRQSARRRYR